MQSRTAKRVAGAIAIAGAIGIASQLGRRMLGQALHRHNELFVGEGSLWYDRLAPHLLGPFYRRVAEQVVAVQGIRDILDVGCGPGHVTLAVAKRGAHLLVRGVDLSADMVHRATNNAIHLGLAERVRFDTSERTRLPYEDAAFDLVISTLSMHHWEDVPGMLRELVRVVRPGGQIWIYDVQQAAMDAHALAAAVPGEALKTSIERMLVWLGPIPIPRFVKWALTRRGI